jgi:hypothetical protein
MDYAQQSRTEVYLQDNPKTYQSINVLKALFHSNDQLGEKTIPYVEQYVAHSMDMMMNRYIKKMSSYISSKQEFEAKFREFKNSPMFDDFLMQTYQNPYLNDVEKKKIRDNVNILFQADFQNRIITQQQINLLNKDLSQLTTQEEKALKYGLELSVNRSGSHGLTFSGPIHLFGNCNVDENVTPLPVLADKLFDILLNDQPLLVNGSAMVEKANECIQSRVSNFESASVEKYNKLSNKNKQVFRLNQDIYAKNQMNIEKLKLTSGNEEQIKKIESVNFEIKNRLSIDALYKEQENLLAIEQPARLKY